MTYTEFTAKTVDEAIEKGLQELNLTRETADIRVLEEGKKKLFGSVKARVEIAALEAETVKEELVKEESVDGKTDGERAVEFLEGLFSLLHITACTELVSEGEKVEINVTAANSTSVIGKHGAMLDAIQTLASAVANTGRDDYKRVVVDCENYRNHREETLNKLSDNLASKALRLQRKIQLEPMNPYERRIIHAALSERDDIKTESEGKEPNRYIVIVPNNLEDETLPALPAREERHHGGNRNRNRGGRNNYSRGGNRGSKGNFNRDRKGGYNKNRSHSNTSGNTSPSGGTTLKPNNDFFGIFLGNSGNKDE